MISGWRVADPEYCTSGREMLSGQGAYLHGGRWNSPGSRIVYLSGSLALASMELLVHLKNMRILTKEYRNLEVKFPEDCILQADVENFPDGWDELEMESKVRYVGDQWAAARASLILEVPSVVIPGETNFLLNPLHKDFGKATYGDPRVYVYDSRLAK